MCWRAVRNKSPALNDLYAPFLPLLDRMNSILRAGSLFEARVSDGGGVRCHRPPGSNGGSIFDQDQLGLFSLGLFSIVTTAGATDF